MSKDIYSLKNIYIEATSLLDATNNTCPICKYDLLKCNICNKQNCKSVIGKCGHGYHLHCIDKWRKTRNVCPLDNQPWEFKK